MKQLGWKEGDGLGKRADGISDCVQLKRREELTGIGFKTGPNGQLDDRWWSNIYNSAINRNKQQAGNKARSGVMGFRKSGELNSTPFLNKGVLAEAIEEEELTSDVEDTDDEDFSKCPSNSNGEVTRVKPMSKLDRLRMNRKTFNKGGVIQNDPKANLEKAEGVRIEMMGGEKRERVDYSNLETIEDRKCALSEYSVAVKKKPESKGILVKKGLKTKRKVKKLVKGRKGGKKLVKKVGKKKITKVVKKVVKKRIKKKGTLLKKKTRKLKLKAVKTKKRVAKIVKRKRKLSEFDVRDEKFDNFFSDSSENLNQDSLMYKKFLTTVSKMV